MDDHNFCLDIYNCCFTRLKRTLITVYSWQKPLPFEDSEQLKPEHRTHTQTIALNHV